MSRTDPSIKTNTDKPNDKQSKSKPSPKPVTKKKDYVEIISDLIALRKEVFLKTIEPKSVNILGQHPPTYQTRSSQKT